MTVQRGFGVLGLSVLAIVSASAQSAPEDLFVFLPRAAVASAPQSARAEQSVVERFAVGMRIDRLFGAEGPATRVRLDVLEAAWIARFQRLDRDVNGFRSWVGVLEGVDYSHVVFTERNGIVSGLINAVSATYQLRTVGSDSYVLEKIDLSRAGTELEPLLRSVTPMGSGSAAVVAGDEATTIDVLLLYTPNARVAAGGTAQIEAIASQVISDSNTIYGRSGVVPRLRLAGTTEFALTEALLMQTDLAGLTDSPTARSLRDLARADLVQLLVSSPDSSNCGIGWLLTSLADTNFDAYSVADIACLGQYTPTHEMGHNMGSHHAPEDGASGALFPYSYGFKDVTRGFRTVMAYTCQGGSCPRIPNLSNPSASHNGGATGTANQNNALSVNNAAFAVANWRQSSGPAAIPSTPTGLQSTVVGTTVSLSWNPSPPGSAPATSYTLQVGSFSGGSNLFNANIGLTTTVSGSLAPGVYFWRVLATNSGGASAPSNESQVTVGATCIAPGAPQNFNFSLSGRIVTLSWTPPASGGAPDVYVLDAGSATGLSDLHSGSTGSASPVAVVQAPPGAYFVRVRAQNTCGTSGSSNEQLIIVQ